MGSSSPRLSAAIGATVARASRAPSATGLGIADERSGETKRMRAE
jgi:hypothetical protein